MKLYKIELIDHSFFGNLTLDFSLENNKAADTVILVGENGSGKTNILKTLFEIYSFGAKYDFNLFLEDNGNVIEYSIKHENPKLFPAVYIEPAHKNFGLYHISNDKLDLCSIFSNVGINYISQNISTVSSTKLDVDKTSSKSENYSATNIKQMLVDISVEDSNDYMVVGINSFKETPDIFKDNHIKELNNNRIARFIEAFKYMFPNIEFQGTSNATSSSKIISFSINGNNINIDNMSSGEKQIIFRGSFLVKDLKAKKRNNLICLIDEPEISMHPKWQHKIMDYYRKMFTDVKNQFAQMFFATHSEYLLQDACEKIARNQSIVIIEIKKTDNKISINKISNISNTLHMYSKIRYDIFHILTPEYYILKYEEAYSRYIKKHPLDDTYTKFDKYLYDNFNQQYKFRLIQCYEFGNCLLNTSQKFQTILTRIRHLFAHSFKNESNYIHYVSNFSSYDKASKDFYNEFEKDYISVMNDCFDMLIKIIPNIK